MNLKETFSTCKRRNCKRFDLTFVDGKATETVTALTKGRLYLILAVQTLKIECTSFDDAVVATRKLETVSPSADLALDVIKGSTDQSVQLVWNKYNAEGFLIGAETDFTNNAVAGTKYTVSSSNTDVATVSVAANGNITITGISDGSTNLVIKEGAVTRATTSLAVVDTTPSITAINFEVVEEVKTAGALNAQVLKAEAITLSSTDYKAEIDATGTIFIDVKGTTAGLTADDIKLGSLQAIYSGVQADLTALAINAGSITATNIAAGSEGTIVVTAKVEGNANVFASQLLK
jgi:hypothetical protein